MTLSDCDLRAEIKSGRLVIDPFDGKSIQPCSVDVRLDGRFLIPRCHQTAAIDPLIFNPNLMEECCLPLPPGLVPHVGETVPFVLHPAQFALAATLERVEMPDDLAARIEGKSSLGRLGLLVHLTAGWIDPGFAGQITLELFNAAPVPIYLYPAMRIAQLSVTRLSSPSERPYGSPGLGSKYKGSVGAVASSYHTNYQQDSSSTPAVPTRDV